MRVQVPFPVKITFFIKIITNMIEYSYLFFYILISFIISLIVFLLSYVFASQSYDSEKLSAYECGFQPFEDARNKFDIKFYLVAILFIIFDLEVSFLFPWAMCIKDIGFVGFWWMFFFLIILTIGFVY